MRASTSAVSVVKRAAAVGALAAAAAALLMMCACTDTQPAAGPESDYYWGVESRLSSAPRPPKTESDPMSRLRYHTRPGEAFEGYYELQNVSDKRRSFDLICLVDYEQVPFELDGRTAETQRLQLDPSQKKWWSLKVPPVASGAHDLVMLLVWEPDDHNLDQVFRRESVGYVSSSRANWIVSDDPNDADDVAEAGGSAYQGELALRLESDKSTETPSGSLPVQVQVTPPGTADFVLNLVGTPGESVAAVALMNGRQVSPEGLSSRVFALPESGTVKRKISTAASERGSSEFLVVCFPRPLTPLRTGEPAVRFGTSGSNRVCVQVR